jgi:hypothetical protein
MRRTQLCALLLVLTILVVGRLLGPPRPALPSAVVGEVRDAHGPVAAARVRWQGECTAFPSDRSGRFRLSPTGGLTPPARRTRVTAWKDGYGIGSAAAGAGPLRIFLTPLPAADNEDYAWIDPTPDPARPNNCGNCHAEIHREWVASAHASGSKNRRFLNLFAGTDWHDRPAPGWSVLAQRPEGAGVCALCHTPTFSDLTFEYDFRKLTGVAALGSHCDYCHKVVDAPADRLGLRFGRDALPLLRPADDLQLFFGPLEDAYREGEVFGHLPLYKESRYCASCHEGVVFGVHAYGTYSEWLESPARRQGKECQSCHMAPTGKMTNIAPGRGGIERDPLTLASHRFPGGDAAMLRRCLAVDVQVSRAGEAVRVNVQVRAQDVGHRVPTGFIDRNLVLVVQALDRAGQAVAVRDGPRLPERAGKSVAGLAGWIYARQLLDRRGRPLPFWAADDDPLDTRLHPGRPDRHEFTFGAAAERVRVRLLYRRFWPEVAESRGWPDNELVVVDEVHATRPGGSAGRNVPSPGGATDNSQGG